LSDVTRAEHFVRALAAGDPLDAQKNVCHALADFGVRDNLDRARLRALLTLGVHAGPLLDALLIGCLPGNAQPRSVEAPRLQAAFELVRSLGNAHGHALRSMHGSLLWNCREHVPHMVLRLFELRRMELLLRPFTDERFTRFPWKELHATYRFGRSSGLLHQSFPVNRPLDSNQNETTLEREYIVVLLQDLVNAGQLPPQDAFWASRRLLHWSRTVTLEPGGAAADFRFGVDVDGDGGPARVAQTSADNWRYLDTTRALEAIHAESVAVRDGTDPDEDGALPRGRRLRLLRKLAEILKPERPVIARRGARRPVALAAEVVAGMAPILRALRPRPDDKAGQRVPAADRVDELFTATGGYTDMQTGTFPADGTKSSASSDFDTPCPPMTMADRSESGCRLHGPPHPLNPMIAGMLVAFRDEPGGAWTIGVVRRVRKRLGGKRVELGVEFIGRGARRVVVAADPGERGPGGTEARTDDRFAAIYLPESASYPTLPIKTLILPSRGFKADDRLSVRARASVRTIVLKEAFEEQADFVWSPFDIVARC